MNKYDQLPDVLTVEELCAFLKISPNTAYELIRQGDLPSIRIGRSIRIPKRALIKKLEGDNA